MTVRHEIKQFTRLQIDLGNDQLNKASLSVSGSLIEQHILRYEMVKQHIEKASVLLTGDFADTVSRYMIESRFSSSSRFNKKEDAIKQLTIDSWKSLIRQAGIYDVMPDKRRNEWDEQKDWVEFTLDNVKDSLFVLLQEQGKFTAEKVDHCFNSLSKSHVTNTPSAFYKRVIFQLSHNQGVIHDLRFVIGKLMNRDVSDFRYYDTTKLLDSIPSTGKWVQIDGGALKIRKYQVGTAHVQFHPEIAWQLNSILSTIHGAAIPESFRRKPKDSPKKAKEIVLVEDLIPYEVLRILNDLKPAYEQQGYRQHVRIPNAFSLYGASSIDKHRMRAAEAILTLIGGVKEKFYQWKFDYDPTEVIDHISSYGQVPNKKSYQYYPTNQFLAAEAAAWLDPEDSDDCLEPEAGQGNMAQFLPKSGTTLVEVSALHCEILKAKGFADVVNEDFLVFAKETTKKYDAILMNPPFSEGRAEAHLKAAINLLKEKGRLVAILPVSAKQYQLPKGYKIEWSTERHNEFVGTSISVVMLKIQKQ